MWAGDVIVATPLGMGANEYYSVNIFSKAFNMILATRRESSGQRIKELYLHNAQLAVSQNVILY